MAETTSSDPYYGDEWYNQVVRQYQGLPPSQKEVIDNITEWNGQLCMLDFYNSSYPEGRCSCSSSDVCYTRNSSVRSGLQLVTSNNLTVRYIL